MTLGNKIVSYFFVGCLRQCSPRRFFFFSLQSFLTFVMIKSLFVTGSRQGKLHLLG